MNGVVSTEQLTYWCPSVGPYHKLVGDVVAMCLPLDYEVNFRRMITCIDSTLILQLYEWSKKALYG